MWIHTEQQKVAWFESDFSVRCFLNWHGIDNTDIFVSWYEAIVSIKLRSLYGKVLQSLLKCRNGFPMEDLKMFKRWIIDLEQHEGVPI